MQPHNHILVTIYNVEGHDHGPPNFYVSTKHMRNRGWLTHTNPTPYLQYTSMCQLSQQKPLNNKNLTSPPHGNVHQNFQKNECNWWQAQL